VTVAASGAGNTVTQPPLPSNGLGAVAAYLSSTVAGAKTLTVTLDPAGLAIDCTAQPVVRFGPRAHVAGGARYLDVNKNRTCDVGDKLVVGFDQPVTLVSNAAGSFALPVSGDSLGTGALLTSGPLASEVTVLLGLNPSLRTRQAYDAAKLAAGAPSGIDRERRDPPPARSSTSRAARRSRRRRRSTWSTAS
jgi:hypothetical protein